MLPVFGVCPEFCAKMEQISRSTTLFWFNKHISSQSHSSSKPQISPLLKGEIIYFQKVITLVVCMLTSFLIRSAFLLWPNRAVLIFKCREEKLNCHWQRMCNPYLVISLLNLNLLFIGLFAWMGNMLCTRMPNPVPNKEMSWDSILGRGQIGPSLNSGD